MAIDDNTLYGLTGAQVKDVIEHKGNTKIAHENSYYADGAAIHLDDTDAVGAIRLAVDIKNDGSEGRIAFDDDYQVIFFPSVSSVNDSIDNAVGDVYNVTDGLQVQIDDVAQSIPTVGNGVLTIKRNGLQILSFNANATSNSSVNIIVPEITMTTTDPGEGAALEANHFIGVY